MGPRGLIADLAIRFSVPGIVSVAPAIILGVYWKGATKNAAIASIVVAIVCLVGLLAGVLPSPMGLSHGVWTAVVARVVMTGRSLVESGTASRSAIDEYDQH